MATIGILIAIVITILILRKVYAKSTVKNLDVTLSISANEATEGDVLTLTEVLTNNKWLPIPWVTVKFRAAKELLFAQNAAVSDAYYRNELFHILMQQKITRRLKFTCSKRGYYSVDGVELTAWDILMEQRYVQRFSCDIRLTVYPGLIPTEEIDELCTQVYGQLHSKLPINPDPFSFRGIREYAPGNPLKAVNFKASARGAGLLVNIWEYTNARQIVVLLDTKRYIQLYNEEMEERAVKIAAAIAEKMQGIPIAFLTNGKSIINSDEVINVPHGIGQNHTRSILESLACIDFTNQDISHLSETLAKITHTDSSEYWLISPYYSKEIEEAILRLKDVGAKTAWIMPGPRPSTADYLNQVIVV